MVVQIVLVSVKTVDQWSDSFNLLNCHALFPIIIPGNWCLWWHSPCSWLTAWTMTSSLPTSLLITLIPQRLRSPMHFSQWMCAVLGIFHILNVINDVALMLLLPTINMIHHNTKCLLLTCFRIRDNVLVIFILIISGVFWLHRLIKFIYNICCYWEIRSFYINALKMSMVSFSANSL